MIKKLYRHEFETMFRYLLPIGAALLIAALLARLGCYLPLEDSLAAFFAGSTWVIYLFGIMTFFVVAEVLIVVRFYRNLFTQEGYLMFTLPVRPAQHFWSKLVVSVCMLYALLLLVVASLAVVLVGNPLVNDPDILQLIASLFGDLVEMSSLGEVLATIVIWVLVNIPLALAGSIIPFYFCIAVGQVWMKNRIAGAVVAYILLSAVLQFLSLFLIFLLSLTPASLWEFVAGLPVPVVFLVIGVLEGAWLAIFSGVTLFIIRHKLNLE